MLKRHVNSVIGVVAVLTLSFGARAQTAPSKQPAVAKSQKAAPAPRRDLSGIWDVGDRMEGISPTGVKSHAPFTAWGEDVANNRYKPGDGPRRVPIGLVNDPLDSCDPAGLAGHLERRARTSEGPGPAMVWILGREMGGRLHVCREHGWDG